MEPITTIIVLCSIGLFGVSIKYLSYRCEQEEQEDLIRIYQHHEIPPIYDYDKPPPYSENDNQYINIQSNHPSANQIYDGT